MNFFEDFYWKIINVQFIYLSNTLLNILLGIVGGLAINVYSSSPQSTTYLESLLCFLIGTISSIFLIHINERIANVRIRDESRPLYQQLQTAFMRLSTDFHKIYVALGALYILSVGYGVFSFNSSSRKIEHLISQQDQIQVGLSGRIDSLSHIIEEQSHKIENLSDIVTNWKNEQQSYVKRRIKLKN